MTKEEAIEIVLDHLWDVWTPPKVRDAMEVLRKKDKDETALPVFSDGTTAEVVPDESK